MPILGTGSLEPKPYDRGLLLRMIHVHRITGMLLRYCLNDGVSARLFRFIFCGRYANVPCHYSRH